MDFFCINVIFFFKYTNNIIIFILNFEGNVEFIDIIVT